MTILITGGCGYIGSHLVHALADSGVPVAVLDNLSTGIRHAVPPAVPLYVGSVGDERLTADLIDRHRVDAIIHLAASTVVPDSLRDPVGYYRNNTVNTLSLLSAAVAGGVRQFVFSSTAAVYGNPARSPVDEDAPTVPQSPYGSSKLMSELMLRDVAAAHGIGYVILRYFNVAGADPAGRTGQSTPEATHLIKVAVQTALGARPKLDIFGTDYPTPDGTCIRDYIHVTDLVRAHLDALDYLRGGGASITLNCGYGHGHSVREVVDAVKRISGREFTVTPAPRRPGDIAAVVADVARIRAVLRFKPQFDDLDAIVRHALAWESRLQRRGNQAVTEHEAKARPSFSKP